MELKHKTALVTGACGGIGRAVVAALVAQGARVVAFDRDIEAVAALAEGSAVLVIPSPSISAMRRRCRPS